jgi:hypothetical protein
MTDVIFPPHLRPNLLGIGAAKAGTTWLSGVLGRHPEIFVHPQKELNALVYDNIDNRLGEYTPYFETAGGKPIRCDFSVRYLSLPQASTAAARLVPDTRVLAVLRNPIDQIQSHYWHLLRQNFHQIEPVYPQPDLFEALDRFPELLLEPALYGKHLSRWLGCFPRDQVLIKDYAELSRDPGLVIAEICAFLDVQPYDFGDVSGQQSAGGGRAGVAPRGGVFSRVFPLVYVTLTRGPMIWLKRTIGVRRADWIKRNLRLPQIANSIFFRPGYPKLTPVERQRLYDRVADDIALLATLDVLDVSAWRP